MSLPAREQQVLDGIETILQADEARLTSMFFYFGRLAGDEEKPAAEELKPQTLRSPADSRWTRGGSREWLRVVILLTVLVAALGAALVVDVSTTSMRTCGPVLAAHNPGSALSQSRSCPSSPSVPTPLRVP